MNSLSNSARLNAARRAATAYRFQSPQVKGAKIKCSQARILFSRFAPLTRGPYWNLFAYATAPAAEDAGLAELQITVRNIPFRQNFPQCLLDIVKSSNDEAGVAFSE